LQFRFRFCIFNKLKRITLILLLLFLTGMATEFYAQTGGRKREHRNQRRGSSKFRGAKSAGNADAFARGGTNKRNSRKKSTAWVYGPTPTSKKQRKEQKYLFSRYRTKGKKYRDGILARQDADRSKRRVRGNKVFHKRKF
jgi:hypothetical protein